MPGTLPQPVVVGPVNPLAVEAPAGAAVPAAPVVPVAPALVLAPAAATTGSA